MSSKQRTFQQNPDDFLLETNFDDDGTSTRAYNKGNDNINNGGNNIEMINRRRSNMSIDRYSMGSVHSKKGKKLITV